MTALSRTLGLAALIATAGCGGKPATSVIDQRDLAAWLSCTECTGGQLDRVVANGPRMVPLLESAIGSGPTTVEDSLIRRQATEAYLRTARYRAGRGIPIPDSAGVLVDHVDGHHLTYRLRAAQALAALDPARAAVAVTRYCQLAPPELARHPEFRPSFALIGSCP